MKVEAPVGTFCLIHGAWHDDACWQLLVALERHGHKCLTPVLPLQDPAASFEDYAAVVLTARTGTRRPCWAGIRCPRP